jgi:hypothetical protein
MILETVETVESTPVTRRHKTVAIIIDGEDDNEITFTVVHRIQLESGAFVRRKIRASAALEATILARVSFRNMVRELTDDTLAQAKVT